MSKFAASLIAPTRAKFAVGVSSIENLIGARQHTCELRIVFLDVRHRLVDRLADIAAFRQREQIVKARVGREIDDTFGVIGAGLIDSR